MNRLTSAYVRLTEPELAGLPLWVRLELADHVRILCMRRLASTRDLGSRSSEVERGTVWEPNHDYDPTPWRPYVAITAKQDAALDQSFVDTRLTTFLRQNEYDPSVSP